jgi:hypothetical protein
MPQVYERDLAFILPPATRGEATGDLASAAGPSPGASFSSTRISTRLDALGTARASSLDNPDLVLMAGHVRPRCSSGRASLEKA